MSVVVVVGFRVTGQAVAAFLRTRGDEIVIVEDDPTDDRRHRAAALGASFVGRPDLDELRRVVAGADLVVPSPGIAVSHPVYRLAADAGVAVRSETELGWQRLAARPAPPRLVAVTGTNGKTTVTSLVAAMLVESGLVAVAVGNIGLPFIEAAELEADVMVDEVSSFQLQYTEHFRPAVSCWLNLAEDHLDWHPTMAHYAAAKARIWAAQGAGDVVVVNADDPAVMAAVRDATTGVPPGVTVVTFSARVERPAGRRGRGGRRGRPGRISPSTRRVGSGVPTGWSWSRRRRCPGRCPWTWPTPWPRPRPPWLRGQPWRAAGPRCAASRACPTGCNWSPRVRGSAGTTTRSPPHRPRCWPLRPASRRWCSSPGGATRASISACWSRPSPRFERWSPSARRATRWRPRSRDGFPWPEPPTWLGAVTKAAEAADRGDVVLLSPGCASFDWYRSYAERGEEFTAAVTALLAEGAGTTDVAVSEGSSR